MQFSVEDREFLLSQSNSKTLPEWFECFEKRYTKSQIYSLCYHNNKPIKKLTQSEKSKIQSQNSRKYNINQDFFKTWSNEMAYVLGLWYADGYIYGGGMFDITLHKKDSYILNKVKNLLGYEGQLYDYVDRQSCRLNFSCKVIYDDIISLGGQEQKSSFPKIPIEHLSHFIRGYFDGDGCIMNLKRGRINSAFTCGSEEFLTDLHSILKEHAGVEGGSYDKSCLSLKFGKKDSQKIGDFMYRDCGDLYLQRKKIKFI